MNTGIIASRYAEALLKYAEECGESGMVYDQAESVENALSGSRKFFSYMESQAPLSAKLRAMDAAAGGMCPSLCKFMKLVIRNGRIQYLRYMLYYYRMRYLKGKNITRARLTTSYSSPEFENRLKEMFRDSTGTTLSIETRTDPAIIGGFVFEVDGKRIDASVSTQIAELRNRFVQKNKRLV